MAAQQWRHSQDICEEKSCLDCREYKNAGVIASLLMAPKSVRGDLWLLVWVLGAVKEGVVVLEA